MIDPSAQRARFIAGYEKATAERVKAAAARAAEERARAAAQTAARAAIPARPLTQTERLAARYARGGKR